jgi:hypothetical protein
MTEHIDKGKDPADAGERDIHPGKARIVNEWGQDVENVTLRHRRGNDPHQQEIKIYPHIPDLGTSEDLDVMFETGVFSPNDYWWVHFTPAGGVPWQCKDDFYCSFRKDDKSATLTLRGDSTDMTVKFEVSSGCEVSLHKQ